MTERAIIVIAICALLAICIVCATFLKWKRHENERAQDYHKTCEKIIEHLMECSDDYSITMGGLSSERVAGKKKVTVKDEDGKEHVALKIGGKIIEFLSSITKKGN